eukprot:jgi/Tetstr1/465921/TSEL_010535.t1
MGCGASKDEGGGASAAAEGASTPANRPTVPISNVTTPQTTTSKGAVDVPAKGNSSAAEPPAKKAGFSDDSAAKPSGVKVQSEGEKPSADKPKKKSAGFAEPEGAGGETKPKKEKKGGGGVKFNSEAEAAGEEKSTLVPGTPFVKLGATFDDLYDEDEDSDEDSDEEDEKGDDWDAKSVKSEAPKKEKKKKGGGVGFADGTEGEEKSTLVPGTPFVKLGGAFDDLFDEDDDEDTDSDKEEEEAKKAEEAEEEKPKKKKKGVGLKFSEDTKEGEDKPPRQPGTPFVKLGAFNDLYDEDDDEDSDEDSDEEGSERGTEDGGEKKPKKEKEGGGVKFSAEAEAAGDEKSTLVPGTPFVKLGATFDDLYDEDDEDSDEDSDASDTEAAPGNPADADTAAEEPAAADSGVQDVTDVSMDLPSIAKVRVA